MEGSARFSTLNRVSLLLSAAPGTAVPSESPQSPQRKSQLRLGKCVTRRPGLSCGGPRRPQSALPEGPGLPEGGAVELGALMDSGGGGWRRGRRALQIVGPPEACTEAGDTGR